MGNLLPSIKHKKNILNLSLSLSLCSIVSSQSRVVACALECLRVLCVARMRSSRINGTKRYWIVSNSLLVSFYNRFLWTQNATVLPHVVPLVYYQAIRIRCRLLLLLFIYNKTDFQNIKKKKKKKIPKKKKKKKKKK